MSNYLSLGSIFQLRKVETSDQSLLEQCLDGRFPVESRSAENVGKTLQNNNAFWINV